jgi:hypothetical protein
LIDSASIDSVSIDATRMQTPQAVTATA